MNGSSTTSTKITKNQAARRGKKLAKRKEVKALMRVSEFVRKA